jgi:hypothetical protein
MADANPLSLLETLEPEALRRQITQLDKQRRGLVVLLRAAVARERATDPKVNKEDEGVRNGS